MNSKTRMRYTSPKGITLIALVITIIVLLILAGVTINMVLEDDGIIAQAQGAKTANEKGTGKDEGALSSVEGLLSRYNMSKYNDVKDENGIAKQNSTINGEKASSSTPVIPKGFKAVEKSSGVYYEVNEGFVIEDGVGNQFVWVPVSRPDEFTELSDFDTPGREPDLITGELTTVDGKTVADLTGSYYDAKEINRKAILEDGYANTNEGLKKQFEDEYNAMVESVKAYGGFYVGRYETGWNEADGVVVSKPGVPMTVATLLEPSWATSYTIEGNKASWYGLYKKQKELYKKNSSSSVVSGMIYGCQWDAIMNWMLEGTEKEQTYVTNSTGMGWYSGVSGNSTRLTGKDLGTSAKNKVKNIYDLAGNYSEFTQEACSTSITKGRSLRGGYYSNSGSSCPASNRDDNSPISFSAYMGSRLQLYIK